MKYKLKALIISLLIMFSPLMMGWAAVGPNWIEQWGITWTFDKDISLDGAGDTYRYGQFANGDYWVVGPVDIVGINPPSTELDGRIMNGSMINPSPRNGGNQGYDNQTPYNPYVANMNVAFEVSALNPLSVPINSSLVSMISIPVRQGGNDTQMQTAAVLTILEDPLDTNDYYFRPPYCGTDKTVSFNTDTLDYSKLSTLAPVNNTPSLATVEVLCEKPWIDHTPGWVARFTHPRDNMHEYGREITIDTGLIALSLNLDYTNSQKERLMIRFTQIGIDLFGIVQDGGENVWGADGGHTGGRKWPILFAGIVLNDTQMRNIGLVSGNYLYEGGYGPGNPAPDYVHFGEDDQTFYVAQLDYDYTHVADWLTHPTGAIWHPDYRDDERIPYEESDFGLPEWGIRHSNYPGQSNKWLFTSYRRTIPINSNGPLLVALIMDAKDLWNHNALFDYVDRHMQLTEVGNELDGWWSGHNSFKRNMWETYRADYGPIWTAKDSYVNIYCVREGATGDGSDWNNAYGQLPDVLERGAAYYIAEGEYGRYTFDDEEVGNAWIYIKKATVASHGTDTGWSDSYGDGQAVFTNTILTAPFEVSSWLFLRGYYDMDGVVGVGPDDWSETCGFKLTEYSADPADYANYFAISLGYGWTAEDTRDHYRFSNIEICAPPEARSTIDDLYYKSYGIYCQLNAPTYFVPHGGTQHVNISNCYIHDINEPIKTTMCDYWTVEYCYFARNYPADPIPANQAAGWEAQGGENCIVRYSLWEDIGGTAVIDMKKNFADPVTDHHNWSIYGNVVYWLNPATVMTLTDGLSSIVKIAVGTGVETGNTTNILTYNNTFINLDGVGTGVDLANTPQTFTGCVAYNNLWYSCNNLGMSNSGTWDYNWYIYNVWSDGEGNEPGPNGVRDVDDNDPFIDWQNKNFNLRSVVESGITLPSPYNRDMFGNVRGADGVWDRGAIEFTGGNVPDLDSGANGEIIVEETKLSLYNNILKSGGNFQATIHCDLKEAGNLSVIVYDSKGNEIKVLFNGNKEAGRHEFTWSASDVGSGIYIVNMKIGNYSKTKKIAVIK